MFTIRGGVAYIFGPGKGLLNRPLKSIWYLNWRVETLIKAENVWYTHSFIVKSFILTLNNYTSLESNDFSAHAACICPNDPTSQATHDYNYIKAAMNKTNVAVNKEGLTLQVHEKHNLPTVLDKISTQSICSPQCVSDQGSMFIKVNNVYLKILSYFNEVIYSIFLNRYALFLLQWKDKQSSQNSISNKDWQSTIEFTTSTQSIQDNRQKAAFGAIQ